MGANFHFQPIAVAALSAATGLLGLLFGILPGHGCLSLVSSVCYTGRGRCDGPIPRPRESYRVCVRLCVIVCDQMQQYFYDE